MRGVPLAGEALGFAEIVRGHPACNVVATPDGTLPLLTRRPGGREIELHVRLHVVLRNALAHGVYKSEAAPLLRDARLNR